MSSFLKNVSARVVAQLLSKLVMVSGKFVARGLLSLEGV